MAIELHPRAESASSPLAYENSPSIRTVLPHLLAANSAWTTELELELLEFAEMCEDYSASCERDSVRKTRANNLFSCASMLCSGSAAVFPHLQNISASTASYGVSAIAAISLIASVFQNVFNYQKGAAAEISGAIQLRDISKQMRLEIAKPLALRFVDPYAKMLEWEEKFAEVVLKISPKVVASDIKSRINHSRRQRMRTKKHSSTIST
jgi:hypothetical protein